MGEYILPGLAFHGTLGALQPRAVSHNQRYLVIVGERGRFLPGQFSQLPEREMGYSTG